MIDKKLSRTFLQREVVLYIIAGVIVTFTNWLLYTLLINVYTIAFWRWANFISIFLSILLAYFLNRIFVFQSRKAIFPEIFIFFFSRAIISLLFEHGFMELMIGCLKLNPQWQLFHFKVPLIKVLASFFVVAGNYFVGKFLIFSKKKNSVQE